MIYKDVVGNLSAVALHSLFSHISNVSCSDDRTLITLSTDQGELFSIFAKAAASGAGLESRIFEKEGKQYFHDFSDPYGNMRRFFNRNAIASLASMYDLEIIEQHDLKPILIDIGTAKRFPESRVAVMLQPNKRRR